MGKGAAHNKIYNFCGFVARSYMVVLKELVFCLIKKNARKKSLLSICLLSSSSFLFSPLISSPLPY